MEDYHLSPSQEFSAYKCDFLMKERQALKHKTFHLFIYISWYRVEHICYNSKWNDRYRNIYVWAQIPIRVLKCHWESFTNSYRESRGYNYIEFHCNINGYVDSIEDMKLIEPMFN